MLAAILLQPKHNFEGCCAARLGGWAAITQPALQTVDHRAHCLASNCAIFRQRGEPEREADLGKGSADCRMLSHFVTLAALARFSSKPLTGSCR